jgi:hypothetical protein
MPRLPMLAGSRMSVVNAPDDAIVLRPPGPLDPLTDVAAAVREALRFPLSGPPLESLVTPRGAVTIVVDPPLLPLPGAPADPRREALEGVLSALEQTGVPTEVVTILVAGGLERRASSRELDALLSPTQARRFRGSVTVHDCEHPDLRVLGEVGSRPVRINPALLDAELVVVVSAAETVLHGGPGALLGACDPESARRAAEADSLLATHNAPGWTLAVAVERLLAEATRVVGVSLLLDLPRLTGRFNGYPHDPEADERTGRKFARKIHGALPGSARRKVLQEIGRELRAVSAFAGPPRVAHAEALLRGIALRGTSVPEPLDAIVLPLPWKSPHQPRAPLNPITASAVALGLALRLWRDEFPVVEDGSAVLLQSFSRAFGHGAGAPYAAAFDALRRSREPWDVAESEAEALRNGAAIELYRAGRTPHPLLPFADWASCAPALGRLGRVIVAGCRDAGAARALGFVPSHSHAAALEMAYGVARPPARVGYLLAPPYPPLVVGAG